MFFERKVLEPRTAIILQKLSPLLQEEAFYLAGGTSLALQIGHRLSIDLDFFCRDEFNTDFLLAKIIETFPNTIVSNQASNSLNLRVDGVKVDIIRYPYDLIEPLVEGLPVSLASVPDITGMKLSAVANRGSKKDFFDLYEIGKTLSLQAMFELYSRKFPNHDPFIVVRSLTYFEDAELEPDPVMLHNVDWPTVMAYFRSEVKAM